MKPSGRKEHAVCMLRQNRLQLLQGSAHESNAIHWGVSALHVAVYFLLPKDFSGNSSGGCGHYLGVPECCHPAGAGGAVFVHRGDLFDAGEQTAGRIGSAAGDWCGPRIYGDFQKGVLPVAHFRGDPGAAGFDPAAEPIWLLIA